MKTVSRDSPNEKILDLIEAEPRFYKEMLHLAYLDTLKIKVTSKRLNFLRDFSTILAILMLVLQILSLSSVFDVSNKKLTIKTRISNFKPNILIYGLGLIQFCTSILMLIFYCIINLPLILEEKWRKIITENKKKLKRIIFLKKT